MAIDLDVHGNTKPLEAAVQAAINRIRRKPIKVTVDDKGATQPLGNMKRAADEFSKSMEAANARILAFGASMAIINGVADAFKGMVRNLVEVEKSMADINVVMGLSAQNLDKFGDGLFKVAKETGAAFRVAADAATEYARQGLSMEESLKRTRDALILTRLTGMDSAEAVKALTAAMNTYGSQIKDTTQLVSKFAAVDVQFAVSAEDFAAAISRTGQAAKSAGVDIDELIGIVTSAQQQTARGGAVIGNALKTIFTKTGRTDTLNQLENLGIAVRDLEGNTIGAKKILSDLANTFDTLSEAQKAQITQTMGGLFHINILKAVLSDAAKQNGILARATEISSSATDEAVQKNQQLRETMSAMATETGLAIKQVSAQIGEIALAPGMEKILNTVKSLAEGLSGVLGDGEGIGNKFATGFLKGVGNIITGPGLVVLTTVFVKLFMTAAKFTKESLSSLIGVTTEAQKQKAIQTSLVALIGQNAALGKELLRTDITRTEKEKILLGLLQAQTAEASKLNAISKQLASTLYTRGYGPGLTQGKRRAYGHIPNYADPERSQAARGGYAAGSIRTMNMPGEGSIIYNSAETVKNFAGFKQPAIMPPQSSKAGKNYQQAFGSIHGFDPYAAGGYIPNFARLGMSNAKFAAKINRGEMTVDEAVARGYTGGLAGTTVSKTSDLKNQRFKHLNKGGSQYVVLVASEGPDSVAGHYFVGNKKMSPNRAYQYPTAFKNKKGVNPARVDVPFYSLDARDQDLNSGKNSPYRNAIYNGLKESGSNLISKILTDLGFGSRAGKRNILTDRDVSAMGGNVFEGVIASVLNDANFKNYKSRGETARIDLPKDDDLYRLFGVKGGSLGAEAKITSGKNNIKDAAVKFYDMLAFGGGFVPNFANPLSDAIGREKAAGVPVSQIRVGSHSALMSKGNPLGLGVTNTHDEPNGLRDVFGANGFVPNYAAVSSDFVAGMTDQVLVDRYNKNIAKATELFKKGIYNQDQFNKKLQLINRTSGVLEQRQGDMVREVNNSISSTSRLNAARKRYSSALSRGIKGMGQGMGGMGLMMGLPMLAGFIPGADKPGSAGGVASGIMSGAATGAALGMIFPGWGTAIGAAVGALGGLVSSLKDADAAIRENVAAEKEAAKNKRRGEISGLVPSLASTVAGLQNRTMYEIMPEEFWKNKDMRAYGVDLDTTLIQEMKKFRAPELSDEDLKKVKEGNMKYEFGFSQLQPGTPEADLYAKYFNRQNKYGIGAKFRKGFFQGTIKKPEDMTEEEYINKMVTSQSIESIASARKSMLSSALNVDPSMTFSGGKSFQKIFGKATVSAERIRSELDKMDPEDLNYIFNLVISEAEILIDNQTKLNDTIILRLNKEAMMLSAQDRFNKEMNGITDLLEETTNQYNFMIRTRGHLMTEEEKAQAAYTQAIEQAATQRYKSEEKARADQGKQIMNILTKEGGDYQKEFLGMIKTGVKDESGKVTVPKMSQYEFGGLSLKEQQDIFWQVAQRVGKEEEAAQILGNQAWQLQELDEGYESIERRAKKRAKTEQEITNELIRQKTGPGAMGRGMDAAFFSMREQVKTMDYELGKKIPYAFADGLANAMSEGLSGAKSIGDALRDSAISFLQMIQQAMLQKAAYSIVGAMGFSGGGNVRNYSRGGGVPAMVSNGEYVMGRDAVAKYGGSFMHGLNAGGKIPGYSNGGSALAANFGGGRGHASGRAYQSRAMSGFFYSQSGNVGLGEDTSTMMGILQEEERKRQEAEARRQAKKARRRQLIGSLVGIAAGAALSHFASMGPLTGTAKAAGYGANTPGGVNMAIDSNGMAVSTLPGADLTGSGFTNVTSTRSWNPMSWNSPSTINPALGPFFWNNPRREFFGGPIRKYASGGYISGKSGIDQIPAMLSEGEYVIRASSARQLGKPMLDRINAGKFNEGGAVSELMGSSETAASGGNTNNINISINMERGSGSKKENQSQDNSGQNPADRSNDEQNNAALAERIKQQVVAVIVEEQRPGGLLSE